MLLSCVQLAMAHQLQSFLLQVKRFINRQVGFGIVQIVGQIQTHFNFPMFQ